MAGAKVCLLDADERPVRRATPLWMIETAQEGKSGEMDPNVGRGKIKRKV